MVPTIRTVVVYRIVYGHSQLNIELIVQHKLTHLPTSPDIINGIPKFSKIGFDVAYYYLLLLHSLCTAKSLLQIIYVLTY